MRIYFVMSFLCFLGYKLQAQTTNYDPKARLKIIDEVVRAQSKNYEVFFPCVLETWQATAANELYLGARVRKNGKYGFLDANNQLSIPCEYEHIYELFLGEKAAVLVLEKAKKYFLFNPKTGKIHPEKYDSLPKQNRQNDFVELSQNGQKGGFYLNDLQADFANILPCQYEAFRFLEHNLPPNASKIGVKNAKGWAFLDANFQPVGKGIYEDIPYPPYEEQNLGYYRVAQKGLYGLADRFSKQILPCEYTQIGQCFDFGFMVQKNGKWGMVDTLNKPLAPFEYEGMKFFYKFSDLQKYALYVCAQKGKKWAVFSYERFKQNTMPDSLFHYDSMFVQADLVFIYAQKADKVGILNPEGEEIYPFVGKLEHTQPNFVGDPDTLRILQEGKIVVYDLFAKIFRLETPKPYNLTQMRYLRTGHPRGQYEFMVQQNGKWGVLNTKDELWQIACEYDTIQETVWGDYIGINAKEQRLFGRDKEQKLVTLLEGYQDYERVEQDIWRVKKAGKYGLIQLNTQKTTDFVYDTIYWFPIGRTKVYMVIQQNKIGLMNAQFQMQIPISLGLDSIQYDGFCFWGWQNNKIVSRKNGKWGVVDTLGNILLPFKYAEAPLYLNTGYWIFRENKKISILENETKRLVLSNLDSLLDTQTKNKLFICKQKSQYKLLDSTFQQIGVAYSGMQKAEFGLVWQKVDYFIVQKNQKYGVMASTGKLVIPLVYDKLEAGGNQFFIARKADKVGVLDTTNQLIVDFEYAQIYRLTNDFFIGEKEGKIQAFSLTKDPLQPLIDKYQSTFWYPSTFYFQDKNGKWGWLNPYSLEILTPQYDSLVLMSLGTEKIYLAARKNGKWGADR